MCMQCDAQARIVVRDVVPGYNLLKALKDSAYWEKDQYALVAGNDPTIIFPTLMAEPNQTELSVEYLDLFIAVAQAVEEQVSDLAPAVRSRLTEACIKSGYSADDKGRNLVFWLIDFCNGRLTPSRVRLIRCNDDGEYDGYEDYDTVEEAVGYASRLRMMCPEEDMGGEVHRMTRCEINDTMTKETWSYYDDDDIFAVNLRVKLVYSGGDLYKAGKPYEIYNPDRVAGPFWEHCPDCGRELNLDSLTCEVCGHLFCDHCHAASADDGLFICERCEDSKEKVS